MLRKLTLIVLWVDFLSNLIFLEFDQTSRRVVTVFLVKVEKLGERRTTENRSPQRWESHRFINGVEVRSVECVVVGFRKSSPERVSRTGVVLKRV